MIPSSLSLSDILLSTLFILFIILGSHLFVKRSKKPYVKKYFFPFILTKIAFTILFVIIHIYVYQGGDTFLYFEGSKFLVLQFLHAPENVVELFFAPISSYNDLAPSPFLQYINTFQNQTTLMQCKIGAPFCLLGFNQFMASTVLFSLFFAIGIWKLFEFFCMIYPKLAKLFAIGTLFIPTMGLWTSGILKDTIILSTIGFFSVSLFHLSKKFSIRYLLIIVICIILCLKLKPYILYAFVPPMIFWYYSMVSKQIKSTLLKAIISPLIFISFAVGLYYFVVLISSGAGIYSLENIEEVARGFQSWHKYLAENRDQSGYSLGKIKFTPIELIKVVPSAFVVTFFRPFPTEIRNLPMALGSLEATILLILTVYAIVKAGLIRTFKLIFSNHHLRSFLLFAVILGVSVGFTSYNFGALSRYKIPCIPFFCAAIAIIYHERKRRKTAKRQKRSNQFSA